MMRLTLVLSIICVTILSVSGEQFNNGHLTQQIRCDHRSPDFENCQAKVFEEECSKRDNEKYRRCRECEPTCAIPDPKVCILSCTPGCVCKDGFLRNRLDRCVPANEC